MMSRCAFGTARRSCAISSCRRRPVGSEKLSEEALAALVTRDAMIGVAKVTATGAGRQPMNGVHDMGGMHGMGPIQNEERRARVPRALGGTGIRTDARDGSLAKMALDATRHQRELIPAGRISAHELLRASGLRHWSNSW